MAVHVEWYKADISNESEPKIIWRPVYSGAAHPDIIESFLKSAEKGDIVRMTARKA